MTDAPRSHRPAIVALLAVVMVAGFVLRTWNINFDRGTGSHPDERSTACFYATRLQLPAGWAEFRDPRLSPLNPLWDVAQQERRGFTYGHFPLYLGTAMGELFARAAPLAERAGADAAAVDLLARADSSCDAIAVAGRFTIAILDTLTILLLYLLGRRIYGAVAGLLAATFYAFAAQAIQLSHFFAMDPASTTFTVWAVLGGVMMVQTRRWRAAVVTGVAAGLAISSKFSALPILAVPIVAAFLVFWQVGQARAAGREEERAGQGEFVAVMGAALALVLAVVAFALTSPYAVLDWQNFVQATLVEQGRMVRGVADFPFTRQYRNTTPYLYFIEQQVQWGLGRPLGIAALAGTLVAAGALVYTLYQMAATGLSRLLGRARWREVSDVRAAEMVVWSWVVPYFGLTGAFLAKFNRYMSPILPFALLFAAGLIWRLWRWQRSSAATGTQPLNAAGRMLAGLVAAVALAGGIFWSLAYVNGVYGSEHTWLTASRWIYANAPPGSTILWELWDDPLPKTVPGEPGMDMGTAGLRNIDWSPYEEDTAEKYLIMRERLQEADYVAYSSKRIYDSVDELPERYPMTNLYYASMWDGSLGFELAAEFTSPPALFGREFDDRHADESWSLYDHPQVTIFRKVRDLSDADYDAIFAGSWTDARHWDRGADSPLSPLLDTLGLGSTPETENSGLINRLVELLSGEPGHEPVPAEGQGRSLLLETPPADLEPVDDYRWNDFASTRVWAAVLWWWAVTALLGWLAWPILFGLMRPLRDRGLFFSRIFGWLLAGWLLWWAASVGLVHNTVGGAWGAVALLAAGGIGLAWERRREMAGFLRVQWPLVLFGEGLFLAAYLGFILVRMANPDIWQPWFGGEKFMEFAFLNGILRSPTFPPVDPHFAGGYINYYYFGIYLVGYLIKLTGIYAEVAFNLAIPTIFALTVVSAFGLAYSAQRPWWQDKGKPGWAQGLLPALLAPFFVVLIGNLDGFAQVVRTLGQRATVDFRSELPLIESLARGVNGLQATLESGQALPAYDFWGPSRVIPYTINEFPFWSFLYADLHPHLIGIPFALLFLGLVLTLLGESNTNWRVNRVRLVMLLLAFSLLLGTLAGVNLWELPTYFGLGVLALLVGQFQRQGRVSLPATVLLAAAYLAGAYLAFWPFFHHYETVGAGGIGLVKEGDGLGGWLLVWGLLFFLIASWLFYAVSRRVVPEAAVKPPGIERALSAGFRRFDRLPRLVYLHRMLVRRSTFGYQLGVWLLPISLVVAVGLALAGRSVAALCLPLLTLATLLLWRRSRTADIGSLFTALLAATGLAVLTGTQIVYLKDFLQGGEWYRMNTLFKFFSQVWVIWGVAAAVALHRLWIGFVANRLVAESYPRALLTRGGRFWRVAWAGMAMVLIAVSLTYPLLGTPARLDQRFMGWRPSFGTINGLDFMVQGVYTWPDDANPIELAYDWEAIQWLLENVRGNPVVVESSEVEYYRAGGSRIASLTGLSGLRGMHASEQRYGSQVGERDGLHREFWTTPDIGRTQEIIDELDVALIYVGQLEMRLHPEGVSKLARMADDGRLDVLYENEKVTIYAVSGALVQTDEGIYLPS